VSADSNWEFTGAVPDGQAFEIGGLDVWKYPWRDTNERAHIKDPLYHQDFTFHVYEMQGASQTVAFAAGEFSNCTWGFYVRKRAA
jgi:hypothetical protein